MSPKISPFPSALASNLRLAVPLVLILTGLFTLVVALFPLLAFSLKNFTSPQPVLIDPSGVSLSLKSLTNAAEWFTDRPGLPERSATSVTHFTLSYPRLNLTDVSVTVDGTDLKQGAILFSGTGLPGAYGNAVIFGHSALPQFFKKGSPLTIFNPLLKAKVGDEIFVNFDGVTYRYLVRKMTEVLPTQIEVLFQDYSRRELTLITCTPLGTYWRRFVVRAELVN